MEEDIKFGKKIFIRNTGKDEYWLQEKIYANPEKLGLGNLVAVRKEKTQSNGGRLDILLKDPTDNTMYEIEVMLGETDPSHIIRSIEYWDNEKRKYPQRQHFAVLIAEIFDRRYFNVIQLLSLNVPMIAIQADMLEVGDEKIINFTKILDVYVEQDDEEEAKQVTKTTWKEKASWTLETAEKHLEVLSETEKNIELKFTQSYISIVINGKNNYMYDKRTKPNSVVWFNVKEEEKVDAIKKILEDKNIVFGYNKYKDFSFTYDKQFLAKNQDLLKNIHEIKDKEFTTDE
ncbi:MAG: hypothetical protein K8R41_10430 [Bacteroidales bacterium]|nr:hypothetical protein [Bacteroidales bacterium]